MQYQDQSFLPSASSIYAGAVGIGALSIGTRALGKREADFWAKNPGLEKKAINFGKNYTFGKSMFGYEAWDKASGATKMKHGLPFYDDARMYVPRRRAAGQADEAFQKLFGRNVKGKAIWKTPAAGVFGLWTINQEMDMTGNLSGIPRGIFRELSAQAGGRIGASVGIAGMRAVTGPLSTAGAGIAGGIGMFAGMAAGAMIGYGALDMIDKMSKTGKAWSTPDIGGNFMDSSGAQTMRQRSLNAIKTSQFNVRAELGREAMRIVGM